MKTQEDVSKRPEFRLALIGKPLCRKSSLAAHFPRPGIVDWDLNITRIRQRYPTLSFKYDQPAFDNDSRLAANAVWANGRRQVREMLASPDVGTIIIDSVSAMQEAIIDWILDQPVTGKMKSLTISGVKVLNQEQYRPFMDQVLTLVSDIATAGKPCIFTFHELEQRSEGGTLELIQPMLTSSLRHNIQRCFTDVWHMTTRIAQYDKLHPDGVAYWIRTVPERVMPSLGTSALLPNEFEFHFTPESFDSTIGKALPWLKGPP